MNVTSAPLSMFVATGAAAAADTDAAGATIVVHSVQLVEATVLLHLLIRHREYRSQ